MKCASPPERVLQAFLAEAPARRCGYDLTKAARWPAGALRQMLARLESEGRVGSEWAPRQDDSGGRPPRKRHATGEFS